MSSVENSQITGGVTRDRECREISSKNRRPAITEMIVSSKTQFITGPALRVSSPWSFPSSHGRVPSQKDKARPLPASVRRCSPGTPSPFPDGVRPSVQGGARACRPSRCPCTPHRRTSQHLHRGRRRLEGAHPVHRRTQPPRGQAPPQSNTPARCGEESTRCVPLPFLPAYSSHTPGAALVTSNRYLSQAQKARLTREQSLKLNDPRPKEQLELPLLPANYSLKNSASNATLMSTSPPVASDSFTDRRHALTAPHMKDDPQGRVAPDPVLQGDSKTGGVGDRVRTLLFHLISLFLRFDNPLASQVTPPSKKEIAHRDRGLSGGRRDEGGCTVLLVASFPFTPRCTASPILGSILSLKNAKPAARDTKNTPNADTLVSKVGVVPSSFQTSSSSVTFHNKRNQIAVYTFLVCRSHDSFASSTGPLGHRRPPRRQERRFLFPSDYALLSRSCNACFRRPE